MINTLKLDPFTRAVWGEFDALAIAQIEPMLHDPCYTPRLYVTPDSTSNNLFAATPGIAASGYAEYGLQITPGSVIVGNFLGGPSWSYPILTTDGVTVTYNPYSFLWRMTALDGPNGKPYAIWDDPVPAWFFANAKGDFPNLWDSPYPVVGNGLFNCEFWNTATNSSGVYIPQIIQVILCVLEPCDPS